MRHKASNPAASPNLADNLVASIGTFVWPTALSVPKAAKNPDAARKVAVNGEVEVAFLRDVGLRNTRATPKELERYDF